MILPFQKKPVFSRRVRAYALAGGLGLTLILPPMVASQFLNPSPAAAQARTELTSLPSFAPMVKKVMPAVVNISATQKPGTPSDEEEDQDAAPDEGPTPGFPPSPFDEFLRKFFNQRQGQNGLGQNGQGPGANVQRIALGSGFIIDPSGYVVTNNHVVANADKVTVVFQDDTKHPAKVIGRDAKTDLALLKIDAKEPLPYVTWGDSNHMEVGDWVLAVGNPFGLGGTVSSGIISARGRDIHAGPYDDFLQIDASINRGNSGGPTFDLAGNVIGINTAIYSPNGGSVGIGFAIPSSQARPVIELLKAHGKIERGWLGVQIQPVSPEIAQSLNLPKVEGALVADVSENGPAAKAGFEQGDVITDFNGHPIHKARDLPIVVAEAPVGQKADVKVWRKGTEVDLKPTLGELPENPESALHGSNRPEASPDHANALGLKLAPLDQQWRQRLSLNEHAKGVVVAGIAEGSPLANAGIEPGDVIESINQQPVATPHEVANLLKEKSAQKTMLLLVNRHGVHEYVAVTIGDETPHRG
ncbi:MAG TPA: DegQ family serine endoprotease [Stellaceae bacterium]|nr:DegQ family serine endoprotease [Stellaceae bacterium]